jgi:hypothetical protein
MPAETQGRHRLVNLRVHCSEREQLQSFAASKGTTVAELIRQGLTAQGFTGWQPLSNR